MPLHVWDPVTAPLSPAWSAPVQTGYVWVRHGGEWRGASGLWVSDGAGGWDQFYAGFASFPPSVAPAGTMSVNGSTTVTLNLSNRQPQWRVRGTQRIYDFGVLQGTTTLDELTDGPFTQPQLGISTTGEVRWDIYYHDPVSNTDGSTAVLNIFF